METAGASVQSLPLKDLRFISLSIRAGLQSNRIFRVVWIMLIEELSPILQLVRRFCTNESIQVWSSDIIKTVYTFLRQSLI